MRSLVPSLLPVAATALAVTTVSTVALPSDLTEAPTRAPVGVVATSPTAPPGRSTTDRSTTDRSTTDRSTTQAGLAAPLSGLRGPAGPAAVPRLSPRGRWAWPLEPRPALARPFIRPASTWGAGHRGVDLATSVGSDVSAVDAGVVSHVGVIAGRGTVTVLHRSGLRSTYEPVDAVVTVGVVVARGELLGTVTAGGHCSPADCLHLGALRGPTYLDPLTLLGATRVRLLPLR